MQTILGSGGAIGLELAKVLPNYTSRVRLVSRNPKLVIGNEELISADILNVDQLDKAIEGSKIVYLTVGLNYSIKVWEKDWPILMKNVVSICRKHNAKLVFFDNVYMYDSNYLDNMTEETPNKPVSKKGMVRKNIVEMLFKEIENGNLNGLIARSADFYGPSIKQNSILTESVFNKLNNEKKADWMISLNKKHSFTYTPDAAAATALLGNTPEAYNQVWHLPTAKNPYTGKEWIDNIARELKVSPGYRVASKGIMKVMGLFIPIMKELLEMSYQYDRDYIFNSDKFENTFNIKPTPYLTGIKDIIKIDYS